MRGSGGPDLWSLQKAMNVVDLDWFKAVILFCAPNGLGHSGQQLIAAKIGEADEEHLGLSGPRQFPADRQRGHKGKVRLFKTNLFLQLIVDVIQDVILEADLKPVRVFRPFGST